MKNSIHVKRAYDDHSPEDGKRILCDRLWPRGISKEKLELDNWAKEISPSNELRKKFHEDAITFGEFEKEYIKELDDNEGTKDFIDLVKNYLTKSDVTLLYSSKMTEENNATVLKEYLEKKLKLK